MMLTFWLCDWKSQSVLVPCFDPRLSVDERLFAIRWYCVQVSSYKTPIPKNGSPLDMGQIDSDKLYSNIMKWNWETVVVMTYTTTRNEEKVSLTELTLLD
jgi:hypothetical protein